MSTPIYSVGNHKPKTSKKPVAAKKASVKKKPVVACKSNVTTSSRPIKKRTSDASKSTQNGAGIFSSLFSSDIRDSPMPISAPRQVEVVIARYNEPNIEILFSKIPKEYKITIYNKGPKDNLVIPDHEASRINVIDLPNVGRCDHTYLHHIVKNYNSGLSDVTIFIVASALDDSMYKKSAKLKVVLDSVSRSYTSVFPVVKPVKLEKLYNFNLVNYTATNKANKDLNPQSTLQLCPIRPFGKWYEEVFKGFEVPELIPVNVNAIFAVDKLHIKNRPLSLYKKLLSYVDSHSNPEAGHYMERSWTTLFHPYPNFCLRKYPNSLHDQRLLFDSSKKPFKPYDPNKTPKK